MPVVPPNLHSSYGEARTRTVLQWRTTQEAPRSNSETASEPGTENRPRAATSFSTTLFLDGEASRERDREVRETERGWEEEEKAMKERNEVRLRDLRVERGREAGRRIEFFKSNFRVEVGEV
ncbi:hypothetical protein L484_023355 [Morus notabilis]|uniref:Uncharacterized protein n=1 Tax=Morus notabilis TaxID=981085 RepID=W9SDF8_9ROSA|nr:hypothetical protein L484_023355 [Morus notabilis]